ncbi:MAG: transcriptional regulator EpsA [Methylotenera sp.]|uniref:XrtB/PEP-CTERM-associated transcriptional regulator EpsA n=1 Tax=Methylotenera sp. TaxID=2051956 RepID=UPI002489B6DE|nr:XrtB/PEP-CTERM-associated transcriptional regulator EpsA [Methylotenera sp.]MDI1309680.1 transcriptional regulator EpsA [Methylotenera sp.]
MIIEENLMNRRESGLKKLINESLHIRSHVELLFWLQGDFQRYIPHEVMIAAWGDFSLGIVYVDIASALPGVRTGKISSKSLTVLMQNIFKYWMDNSKSPFTLNVDKGIFHEHELGCIEANINLKKMKCAIVHGIKDFRGGHDCLYVFINSSARILNRTSKITPILLPFIDSALRQLEHLPEQLPRIPDIQEEPESEFVGILSDRESEIMLWVKMGKTNQEIGMILNISAFTVKNHLQRIFKKLDVLNRAQAATKFNRIYQN